MDAQSFSKELEALSDKYKGVCALVAVPTNVMGQDGYWHPSAEISIASMPPQGVASPMSNNGGIIQA